MRLYVSHKVCAKNQTAMKFLLNANIHQNRAGSLIVGIVHVGAQAESKPLIQQRAHVVRVRGIEIERRLRLILFLERGDLTGHRSDSHGRASRSATKCWLKRASWNWDGQGRCGTVASSRELKENIADCCPKRWVEWRDGSKNIFVEQADTPANCGFAIAGGIPRKA